MPIKESTQKIEGVVKEVLPSGFFKVETSDAREIFAHISGKMRLHYIRLVPGDQVILELTPYDKAKGRIIYRK